MPATNWITPALEIYKDLKRLWHRSFDSGMFEILEYDSTLELLDPRGERAVFKKRLRVKFLQDNVIAFEDYAWGDGEIFLRYRCSPGIIVDRYRDGERWNVLISMRQTKNAGDVEEFHLERQLRGSFLADEGWWETSLRHRTQRLKVCVLFPEARSCKQAVLIERNRNRTTPLDARHFDSLPDGRQLLTWESSRAKRFERYTLKWRW